MKDTNYSGNLTTILDTRILTEYSTRVCVNSDKHSFEWLKYIVVHGRCVLRFY